MKFLGFFMQLNPPIYYWTTLKGYKIPSKIIPKTTLKSDCIYFHMESSFAHRHTFSHIRGMRMENKRRGRRVKEENRLICEIVSDNKDLNCKKVFYTLTKDISLGGVNIQTDTFLPVDTVVKMELSLPKIHKIVCIRGKVKWTRSLYDDEVYEMGLEFIDTPPDIITSLIGHLYSK